MNDDKPMSPGHAKSLFHPDMIKAIHKKLDQEIIQSLRERADMGMIKMDIVGSFRSSGRVAFPPAVFSAMEHGHAQAVADAIKYLAETVMPEAIALDHNCHNDGEAPAKGFSTHTVLIRGRTP